MKKLMLSTALAAMMAVPASAASYIIMTEDGERKEVQYDYDMNPAMALETPTMTYEGYEAFPAERYNEITFENLNDADVYGLNNEEIGEIEDFVLNADGTISGAIIEVGGFLGLGEKEVLVPMDRLQIMTTGGVFDGVRVYIDSTEERLEALPEFEAQY